MSDQDEPQDLGEVFAQFGRELGNALADLGFVTAGQGAMGWILQGEPGKAHDALSGLVPEQRAKIADAARRLATLAEQGMLSA
jgi:hypothetical protein